MIYDIIKLSPNHGGTRTRTDGIIIHSTRGGALTLENEFQGTINWFSNSLSEVSAHVVIAYDGQVALIVPSPLKAYHAGTDANASKLSVELVQRARGDDISDAQYRKLAEWCIEMSQEYGFLLTEHTLLEHKDIPQGIVIGKSDVDAPFSVTRLLTEFIYPTPVPLPEGHMTAAEKAVIRDVIGPLRTWATAQMLRADATNTVGAGEPWQFADPFTRRLQVELTDAADRLEALLT